MESRKFCSLDAVQRWAISECLAAGAISSPRGVQTREVIAAHFCLTKPRSRCIVNPARKWSLPLAAGEFCWHLAASDDLKALEYYAPRWRDFSHDGRSISGSAYGRRIFLNDATGESQWTRALALLQSDPDTRRAVLNLQQAPADSLSVFSLDVSCSTSVQFLLRDGCLNAVTTMRSNDVILGLPYDVFLFTMLQEMMAKALNVHLGSYYHWASSLHIYEHCIAWAERILKSTDGFFEMPEMGCIKSLPELIEFEAAARAGGETVPPDDPYWRAISAIFSSYGAWKRSKSDVHATQTAFSFDLNDLKRWSK